MKDIILQNLKSAISNLTNQAAEDFITKNLPENPTLSDYQTLLAKVQSGDIQTP